MYAARTSQEISPSSQSSADSLASLPLAYTYRLTNNFREWPTWNYPTLYDVYCVNYTIPGEQNFVMGTVYVLEYLFYLALYIPSLWVIATSPLINHASYKLMFTVGVLDNCVGFLVTFMGGVLSFMGANYCDNTMLLIVVGHLFHGFWFTYCMSGVLLAFNRYVKLKSKRLSERLFSGRRCWLWLIIPAVYGAFFSSSWDLPPIYNSVWSVYLFQIDMREDAVPVNDWVCFSNSIWVVATLASLYSMLFYELEREGGKSGAALSLGVESKRARMQKKVLLQSFLICFFLFLVAASYAWAGFVSAPLPLTKFATIAVQLCTGFTSIVYLLFNDVIRAGVVELLCKWCYALGLGTRNPQTSGAWHRGYLSSLHSGLTKSAVNRTFSQELTSQKMPKELSSTPKVTYSRDRPCVGDTLL